MGFERSGRRPKPIALRQLQGNPGKRKLTGAVVPPSGAIVVPGALSGLGRAVWDEIAPVCLAMGTLTTADVQAFATLCELEATIRQARPWKDQPKTLKAALRIELRYAAQLRAYYALFGLDPVSRARLQTQPTEADIQNKWAGILK